ncbi:MAG TPA: circularly permuted type 2 ATP-grasp protein [Burkholderiales bacterium]|nr:circularly permuted type 2 ATP-grasp protein [Burkholderiales bacterium]
MIGSLHNEMHDADGRVRPEYQPFAEWLKNTPPKRIAEKREQADLLFHRLGITFAVYGEEAGAERLIPFDIIPRIISAAEWKTLASGLTQRIRALNAFLNDVYHEQDILRAGRIPSELVLGNPAYRAEMRGVDVPAGIYCHIAGIDVVRAGEGEFFVLEDNLRTPSGVSYMLENRNVMMRLLPELFARQHVAPVAHYPDLLCENLRALAPAGVAEPAVVVLTPGPFNSAYFEHAYLAEQMGLELVQGNDLFVRDNAVYMRTTQGPRKVDVIYRRIDDEFLDPEVFRADSMLGVPGLFSVYRSGGVTLANAIGTGIADDKATYVYVPEMIRFYLGEEPVISNVPTFQLRRDDERAHVLEHLDELVVKEVHGSGGYGMLVGPAASAQEREAYKARIMAAPQNFIAQPTLALSTCPTLCGEGTAPRHVDLRPFVLSGTEVSLVPGGLTRVALREGSLVVNSSQGGGTKDTWVLEE